VAARARQLKLRRADRCVGCGCDIAAGQLAVWDAKQRQVRCVGCEAPSDSVPPPPILLESAPGASARREYERRRDNREARAKERLGPLAGVALALAGEPSHQRAWDKGSTGEVKLAAKLERWTADAGVVLLHDRRVPGSVANIDHIAVGPSGVLVIDAKRYSGRIGVERRGGLFTPRTQHLVVAGRDRSKLVDGVLHQRDVVQAHTDVPVRAVLCFVDGDWPLFGALEVRGVPVVPPRKAARLCSAPGSLDTERIRSVALRLAEVFVPA
jgi:hypothetical protein